MKKLVLALFVSLTIMSCSQNKSDNGNNAQVPPVVPQATAIYGVWSSQCLNTGAGSYIERLTIRAEGDGTKLRQFMQGQNCTGLAMRNEGPYNFNFVIEAANTSALQLRLNFMNGTTEFLNVVSVTTTTY